MNYDFATFIQKKETDAQNKNSPNLFCNFNTVPQLLYPTASPESAFSIKEQPKL